MKKRIFLFVISVSFVLSLCAQHDPIQEVTLDSIQNIFIKSSIKNQWQIDSSGLLRFRLNVFDYLYSWSSYEDVYKGTIIDLLGNPLGTIEHEDGSYTLGYVLMRNPNVDRSNSQLSRIVSVAAFRFDEKLKLISCDDMEFLFGSRLDLFWNRCDSLSRGLIKE